MELAADIEENSASVNDVALEIGVENDGGGFRLAPPRGSPPPRIETAAGTINLESIELDEADTAMAAMDAEALLYCNCSSSSFVPQK
jgi:hypothetical protein